MKTIVFENSHRKKHFEFFKNLNHPHFNITAPVVVDPFIKICREKQISVHLALVYLISHVANEIDQFRWRIRGNEIIEHPVVHPSFTVSTEASGVFSFCEVKYDRDAAIFLKRANKTKIERFSEPRFEDEEGRDDYLFLSSFPWVSFTGYQHAMQFHPHDSVPRISWGKLFSENEILKIPLSVQAHHAIVDGSQVGLYFEKIESCATEEGII